MTVADEYLVRANDRVLHYGQATVADRFARIAEAIRSRVAGVSGDEILGLETQSWAQ